MGAEPTGHTVADLWERYEREELPRKAGTTQASECSPASKAAPRGIRLGGLCLSQANARHPLPRFTRQGFANPGES